MMNVNNHKSCISMNGDLRHEDLNQTRPSDLVQCVPHLHYFTNFGESSKDFSRKNVVQDGSSDSTDSVTDSALLFKDHLVLVNPETGFEAIVSSRDVCKDVGYTESVTELNGAEQAFKNIQNAKDKAAKFISKAKEDNERFLSSIDIGADEESNQTIEHTVGVLDSSYKTGLSNEQLVYSLSTSGDLPSVSQIGKNNTQRLRHSPGNDSESAIDALFQDFNDCINEKLPFGIENCTGLHNCTFEDTVNEDCAPLSSTEDPSVFSQLPYEIIQKILGYLSLHDLCHKVALVNKKWKEYAYDPIFYTVLELNSHQFETISSFLLGFIIQRAPLLQQLNLSSLSITLMDMLFIAKSCPLLRVLDIGFLSIPQHSIASFLNVIAENCHNLEYLNVEGCSGVNPECISVLCEGKVLEKLKGLNVAYCAEVSEESLLQLVSCKHQLEVLNIDGITGVTDSTVKELVELRGKTLRKLYLDGCELTSFTLENIQRGCDKLEVLTWSFGELLAEDSMLLIKDMDTLKELQIKKAQYISSECIEAVFTCGKLNGLTRLDLTECVELKDAGVEAITKCCGVNLTQLSLCWCWNITDVALEHIVNNCRNAVSLYLIGCDKLVGHCLLAIPSKMPNLTLLDLNNCNSINDDVIIEVVRGMPELKAINYYGEEFVQWKKLTDHINEPCL